AQSHLSGGGRGQHPFLQRQDFGATGLVDDDRPGHFGVLGLRGADLGRDWARAVGVALAPGFLAAATPAPPLTEPVTPVNGATAWAPPVFARLRDEAMMLMVSTSTEKAMAA